MKKLLAIFLFIYFQPIFGYDTSFSQIISEVYTKYHVKENDWCDQLKETIDLMTLDKGRSLSCTELFEAGVDSDYLDIMALEYCNKYDDCHIAIVWPTVGYDMEETLYKIMEKYSIVAYHKKITLKGCAPIELLKMIPEKQSTYREHFYSYFPKNQKKYPMMCFLLRAKTLEDTVKIKSIIRKLYNAVSFHVHINDFREECLKLAHTLFNNNSIHFLNYFKPRKFKTFELLIQKYEDFLKNNNIPSDDVCIDGSCVLSAYGIRDTALDLDFLYIKEKEFNNISPLDHHNEAWIRQGFDVADVIYNPKHFFFHKGLKFASLPLLREFKAKQGRQNDLADVKKMNRIL
jgi:hypothetical protein